jgi:hypothetical protein
MEERVAAARIAGTFERAADRPSRKRRCNISAPRPSRPSGRLCDDRATSPGDSALARTLVTPHLRARRAKSPRKRSRCHETSSTAGADGSLDVIAETAKRRRSHDGAVRRYATSTSGGATRIHGRGGKSADPIRPRKRIRPPARLSLPCPPATRGWR